MNCLELPWKITNKKEGVAYLMNNAPLEAKKLHLPIEEDIQIPMGDNMSKDCRG